MTHFNEYLPKDEIAPINALITRILEAGHHIAVHDGEEYATGPTRDRALIQKETCETEMTVYVVLDQGKYLGQFVLIHGNGEDVISDASAPNHEMLDYLDKLGWPEHVE